MDHAHNELQLRTNELLNWLLHSRSNQLFCEPRYVQDMLVANVRASNAALPVLALEESQLSCADIQVMGLDTSGIRCEYANALSDLQQVVESIRELVCDFIVVGSLATADYVMGWSDLDIIVIIKDNALVSLSSFLKLRNSCLLIENEIIPRVDKLQHHGVQCMLESDLKMYPDIFYPHELFIDGASLLHEKNVMRFMVRDSSQEQVMRLKSIHDVFKDAAIDGALMHHGLRGVFLKERYVNADDNMYQFKYMLSVIMLLPTLWMNARGMNCRKGDSFELVRPYITPETWKIVEQASEVRRIWKEFPVMSNEIPKWVQDVVPNDYLERAFCFVDELWNRLYD